MQMAFLITSSSVLRLPLATWEGEEDILVLAPMYLQKAAFLFIPIQSFCSWVDEDKSQSLLVIHRSDSCRIEAALQWQPVFSDCKGCWMTNFIKKR